MVRQRSILSLILVLLTTFLISCGSPSVATAPPTYTPAQVAKIQEYFPDIQVVRDRSQELQTLIQSGEWIKVGNFIHGPMTEARLNMTYVIPNLLAQDQSKARQITKDLLSDLVKIDKAASGGNTSQALSAYKDAFADVDKFLQLIPE
ncbi:MAG: photosystem II protein PsbQ [Sphaerospermopsis kisseleviana]|uniref:photosystem II protein PsbQ n=1 Tax=unclassified Sphaerospermopsis TaxID=2646443 RepID=UPI0016808A4E|nr:MULTISPECIES: photosystem II protein PsbQ [unclassified Sphaerospermopsis]MBD2131594.1 photosystem II protein PsbQ [Sphaerospermopsis sp. FACHB-1094]MBD2146779.1 photosystem II protein PsbQ [Sphaerospermopsis sp. FACHB-1194]